jgi:hypothetical protein
MNKQASVDLVQHRYHVVSQMQKTMERTELVKRSVAVAMFLVTIREQWLFDKRSIWFCVRCSLL